MTTWVARLLAKVVPVRIANSVVHLWTSTVAQGFNYARQIGADVVSMSMGGLPSEPGRMPSTLLTRPESSWFVRLAIISPVGRQT